MNFQPTWSKAPLSNTAKAQLIRRNICAAFGIPVESVLSGDVKRELVYVRKWIIWYLCQYTTMPLRDVGKMVGYKDHTSASRHREDVTYQIAARFDNKYKTDYSFIQSVALEGLFTEKPPRYSSTTTLSIAI